VDRLRLLKQAVCGGRRISDVAGLDCESLERLISEDRLHAPAEPSPPPGRPEADRRRDFVAQAVEALERLDRYGLERVLAEASIEMSGPEIRAQLIVPLLATIGERWKDGSLRIVHEHLATTVIRSFLTSPRNHIDRIRAPRMVVSTPSGQYHELGALMACAVAEEMGWDVLYLGASLPPEEVAAAVRQTGARAVALSLCYRESNNHVLDDLVRLRSLLDADVPVFVGGNAAHPLRDRLRESGLECPSDFADFRARLQTVPSE
jgi:methanogenic corrinoid protein MtbC1